MDSEFLMECSAMGLKRIRRALRLSRVFGFRGICFLVPRQFSCLDIGYGQGEGQFDIRGLEVGIYRGFGILYISNS